MRDQFIICLLMASTLFYAVASYSFSGNQNIIVTGSFGYSNFPDKPNSIIYLTPTLRDTLVNSTQEHYPTFNISAKEIFPISRNKYLDSITIGPSFIYQKMAFNGEVWVFGLPQLNNYNYTLTTENLDLLLEGDLRFATMSHGVYPFLTMGAGIARANVHYNESANTGVPPNTELHLDSQYNFNFIYELGVGLGMQLNPRCDIFIRYAYLHLGETNTSKTTYVNLLKPVSITQNSQNIFIGFNYSV